MGETRRTGWPRWLYAHELAALCEVELARKGPWAAIRLGQSGRFGLRRRTRLGIDGPVGIKVAALPGGYVAVDYGAAEVVRFLDEDFAPWWAEEWDGPVLTGVFDPDHGYNFIERARQEREAG